MENDRTPPAGPGHLPPEASDARPPHEPLLLPAPVAPKRSRWRGALVALVGLLALGSLAWYLTHRNADGASGAGAGAGGPPGAGGPGGPGGGSGSGRRGPPATTVGVATAATADIPLYIDALGTVTPSATIVVRPQVSGVLTRVLFDEGQLVHAGQVLATIEPRPFDLALTSARGQLLRDQAQLENARLTLKRYQTLLQEDSIARQDVDTQAALVKQQEGVVMSDQAAVGTAQLNQGWTRITAPAAGRIGLRTVDVGNLVSSGDANGVATITRLAPIDVEFAIPQDRVPDLQARIAQDAQLPVTVFDRTRSDALDTGKFLSLNNQTDTTTGTVKAKARFANAANRLFPSEFVNVRVLLDTLRGAVVVPVTALRHGPNGDFVWVLNDDRTVTLTTVVTGPSTADRTSIKTGLRAGQKVITEGGDRLKDGARVVLPGDAPASGAGRRQRGAGGTGGASGAGGGGAGGWRHGASAPRDQATDGAGNAAVPGGDAAASGAGAASGAHGHHHRGDAASSAQP